jgi:hypothetical protein
LRWLRRESRERNWLFLFLSWIERGEGTVDGIDNPGGIVIKDTFLSSRISFFANKSGLMVQDTKILMVRILLPNGGLDHFLHCLIRFGHQIHRFDQRIERQYVQFFFSEVDVWVLDNRVLDAARIIVPAFFARMTAKSWICRRLRSDILMRPRSKLQDECWELARDNYPGSLILTCWCIRLVLYTAQASIDRQPSQPRSPPPAPIFDDGTARRHSQCRESN